MSIQLFPHLTYDDAETLDSYIRRLGNFHTGRDGRSLLADLGIDARGFVAGSDHAVSSLSAATGIDPVRLKAGMISKVARHRDFRGESCNADFVRPEGAQICPECLREDAQGGRAWLLKGRISWRLRPVQTCPLHACKLAASADPDLAKCPDAVFTMLTKICDLVAEPQIPTEMELSITHRLAYRPTQAGDWLDSQTIEQGVKACEMIGATLSHGLTFSHRALSPEDWRQAGAVGFSIARCGADAVDDALTQVAAMSTTTAGQAGPKAVYGRIFEWLAYNTPLLDPGPIRRLLRENILNTIVIEPDEVLLGERVKERRLHSVYSLSLKTKLHLKRLRKIVVQAGLASDDSWDLAAHRLVFPVEASEQLCSDIVNSIPLQLVPETIGCSRTQAESLYREGVLKPVVAPDPAHGIGKLAFARRDLASFLSRLELLPVASPGQRELIDLVSATKRTGRSTADLMARVLSGELAAFRDGRAVSVNGIRLALADLEPVRTRRARDDVFSC